MNHKVAQTDWTPAKLEKWVAETEDLLAEIPDSVDYRIDGIRSLAKYAWHLAQHKKRGFTFVPTIRRNQR